MSRFQTLYDQAFDVLKDMEESVPSIDFSLLTYADGRILATTLRKKVDQELIACVETMAFCISSNLSNLLTGGKIEKLVISGKDDDILIQGVGRHTILSIAIKKGTDVRTVVSSIAKYHAELEKIEENFETLLNQYYSPSITFSTSAV